MAIVETIQKYIVSMRFLNHVSIDEKGTLKATKQDKYENIAVSV
jgi:hypothetical protein